MIPVILSGGSGTRLWPLSRPFYPKQFLPLYSEHTLFQDTVKRLQQIGLQAPMVVSNDQHRFIVAENMRALKMNAQQIILEPTGRNTAPAIAIAALSAMDGGNDPILLVLPADHVIQNTEAFGAAVRAAEKLAQQGNLVTFGIKPTEPHTGYGYIECGVSVGEGSYKIAAFKEKPSREKAEVFFKQDNFYWNSGMFVFKASDYLKELEKHEPEILKNAKEAMQKGSRDLDFFRLDKDAFDKCKDISIDYAVMEKTDRGVVVTLDAQWCDVGSWNSLWEVLLKDADGNVTKGDVMIEDSRNNYIYSEHKLVSAIGVEDLIVIDTKDALLIANRHKSEEIKKVVENLKKAERSEAKHHRVVYRPWGHYDSISLGARDQVKRITVNPGQKLSIQMHHHRAEHWVVVKGTASVLKGEETILLSENQSVYLPLGIVHALENPGRIPLEIIEVQTGSYLGEDDIVRFEDIYGRVG